MSMWGSKAIEPRGPLLTSRTSFLGDFVFPAVGRLLRHAALAEIRRSAQWDAHEIGLAMELSRRIRDAKPEELPGIAASAGHVVQMLQDACTRGAKYQVAAEALLQRVDKLERELARLRRAAR